MAWTYHTVQLIMGCASYAGEHLLPFEHFVRPDTHRDPPEAAARYPANLLRLQPVRAQSQNELLSACTDHLLPGPSPYRLLRSQETVPADRVIKPHEDRSHSCQQCEISHQSPSSHHLRPPYASRPIGSRPQSAAASRGACLRSVLLGL